MNSARPKANGLPGPTPVDGPAGDGDADERGQHRRGERPAVEREAVEVVGDDRHGGGDAEVLEGDRRDGEDEPDGETLALADAVRGSLRRRHRRATDLDDAVDDARLVAGLRRGRPDLAPPRRRRGGSGSGATGTRCSPTTTSPSCSGPPRWVHRSARASRRSPSLDDDDVDAVRLRRRSASLRRASSRTRPASTRRAPRSKTVLSTPMPRALDEVAAERAADGRELGADQPHSTPLARRPRARWTNDTT